MSEVPAVRQRAVELVEQSSPGTARSQAERRVARLFGVRRSTVHGWVIRSAATDVGDIRQPRQDPGEEGRLEQVSTSTRVIALVALFLAGLDQPLAAGTSTGLIVVAVLAPVWWPVLRRYVGARLVVALAALCLLTGWWLTQLSRVDHSLDAHDGRATVLLILTCFGTMGLLLWARLFLPRSLAAMSFGAGLALASLPTVTGGALNPWKFGLAIPAAFVTLGLCARTRSRVLPLAVLSILAAVSLLNDSRSYSGFCVLAAVLVVYQNRRGSGTSGWRRLGQVAFLGGLVVSAYFLITSLLVQGYLGEELQLRTRAQIENSGSLIAGGRPEWSATLQLVQDHPLGYGIGVVPNSHDILVGKTGLDPLHIPTIDGYAEHYMFGGQFKLHSVAADLWSHFGASGVLLTLLIAVLLVNALTRALSSRTASALVGFVIALALWDLAFGPIYSNLRYITLALGLALYQRTRADRRNDVLGAL
jgi:hypothetical protein